MNVRKLLWAVVAIGSVMLASSCIGLGSDAPQSAAPQMAGPAFNNAGDNGPMVLLAVVITVVLVAAGALALSVFREWREERAELRAQLRRLNERAELPGEQSAAPLLNGHRYEYGSVDYRAGRRQIRR